MNPNKTKELKPKTPELYIYIYFCFFFFKRENNCSKPIGQYGGGGEQSYRRGLRTSPWEQRTNTIQRK